MTQEEKELLMIDLCSRLSYKTYVRCESREGYYRCSRAKLNAGMIDDFKRDHNIYKPFLRPMSSMTEEEKEEYWSIKCPKYDDNGYIIDTYGEIMDWLNAHHFDYRRLIEKGLALEAPERMYDNKK